MTLYRPGETDAATYIPPAVSGFFPTDLFNYGSKGKDTGQAKTSPNITQDVVYRDSEGAIIYWRMLLEDARGGLNRTRGKFDEDFDRIASSDADARFYRHLILPQLTYTQSSPGASGTITGIHSAMFNDRIHISLGSTSPTSVDFITSAAQQAAAQVYRITDWHGTTPPEEGTATTGTDDAPNPPDVVPSWGVDSNLWISGFGADINAFAMNSTAHTDWTNGLVTQSDAASAGGVGLFTQRRELTDDAPGNNAVTIGAVEEWVAQTVVIRPSEVVASSGGDVRSSLDTSVGASSTTHNIVMPATIAAGDLLLAFIMMGASTSVTTPAGWTRLATNTHNDDGWGYHVLAVYAKVAVGNEDGTNVNFVTNVACLAIGHVASIQDWYGTLAGVEVSSFHTTSSAPNPPSITQSWGTTSPTTYFTAGTTAINITHEGGGDVDLNAQSGGTYTALESTEVEEASPADRDMSMRTSYRQATAASENPPTFTLGTSFTDDASQAITVAVRGAVSVGSYPQVESVTETVFPTDTTAHNVVLPASDDGDLLVLFFTTDADSTVTTPAGWTALHSTANGTAVRLSTYYQISDGTAAGEGSLFRESSDHHPIIELTQYDPGDAVTSLATVVLGGADEPQRLLVGRQTTAMQLLNSDYSVAGTLHADTEKGWGAIQTFTNDDLIILYADGALRTLAKTDAITDQPLVALENVPNGGFVLGMIKLGGAPLRPVMVWPYEDDPDSMLEFGSERPGRVVFTNNEATDYQEIPMGMTDIYNAVNVGGYAVAAHNKRRLTLYDGTSSARDLQWVSDRDNVPTGQTLELRGMFDNGSELWVEVVRKSFDDDENPTDISRWWEVYNLDTNSWYQVSATKSTNRTDNACVLPAGKLPYSTTSRYLWTYTGSEWHSIYVPQYGYNPAKDLEAHHHYEASATYMSTDWEIPGLEGWPKIVSRIIFLGDVDAGGADGTPATVIIRAGGAEATFATGLAGRAQIWSQTDAGDFVYTIQVEIEMSRTDDSDTETPIGLPVAIEGFCFIEALPVPSGFRKDSR